MGWRLCSTPVGDDQPPDRAVARTDGIPLFVEELTHARFGEGLGDADLVEALTLLETLG